MSTYTGVTNCQKTVRFFWPTLYLLRIEYDGVFEFAAADWSIVAMETSAPLIEMDSAVIDKGTEEQLVNDFAFHYCHILTSSLNIITVLNVKCIY